jgi:hypothetical protein
MKKAWVKVKEDTGYDPLAPQTYADMVYVDESHVGTLLTALDDLKNRIVALEASSGSAQSAYVPVKLVINAAEPPLEENILWVKPKV